MSAYELHSSGLVPALQNILYPQSQSNIDFLFRLLIIHQINFPYQFKIPILIKYLHVLKIQILKIQSRDAFASKASKSLYQILYFYNLADGFDTIEAEQLCSDRITVVKEWAETGDVTLLVRHLIAVLESVERLPVIAYDAPPAAPGLQILTRRLRYQLILIQSFIILSAYFITIFFVFTDSV